VDRAFALMLAASSARPAAACSGEGGPRGWNGQQRGDEPTREEATCMDPSELKESARQAIDETPACLLITTDDEGFPAARQMGSAVVEDDFTVWMATATVTAKCGQIEANPKVTVYWPVCSQCKPGFGHVIIKGTAELTQDQTARDRLWRDSFSQYFPQGSTDPTYVLIKVTPASLSTYLCGTAEIAELSLK
jgi:general stress protein 26